MADETTPAPQAPAAAPQATQSSAAPSGAPSGAPSYGGGHGGPRHSGPGGPGGPGGRPGGPAKRGKRSFVRKKKVCRFCVDKADFIDYKKAEILAPFIQERGKILPRRMTGTCARHQRWLAVAIKRAQNIALLPFAAEL
jgi:small subunit ribosomal protein S18